MLNLGLFNPDRNRRILMDRVDPVVPTKHVQSASYGFIETVRRDFDGMFRAVRVDTRYFASGGDSEHPMESGGEVESSQPSLSGTSQRMLMELIGTANAALNLIPEA